MRRLKVYRNTTTCCRLGKCRNLFTNFHGKIFCDAKRRTEPDTQTDRQIDSDRFIILFSGTINKTFRWTLSVAPRCGRTAQIRRPGFSQWTLLQHARLLQCRRYLSPSGGATVSTISYVSLSSAAGYNAVCLTELCV